MASIQWTWVWTNPGISERQARLVCCSPWDSEQVDTTQPLNNTTFLNSIISSKTGAWLLCIFLGLSPQIIRLSANRSSLSFLVFKNFISFSCLIFHCLELSVLHWTEAGEWISLSCSVIKGKHSAFPASYDFHNYTVRYNFFRILPNSTCSLSSWKVLFLIFWRGFFFFREWVPNYPNAFSSLIDMIM